MSDQEFLPKIAPREEYEMLLRRLQELRMRADFDGLEALFAPDASVEYIGKRPEFEHAGLYKGRADIVAIYRRIHSEIAFHENEVVDLIIEADQAFCRRRVLAQHRGTGRRERLEAWDIWRVRDDRLVEGRVFIELDAYIRMSLG